MSSPCTFAPSSRYFDIEPLVASQETTCDLSAASVVSTPATRSLSCLHVMVGT